MPPNDSTDDSKFKVPALPRSRKPDPAHDPPANDPPQAPPLRYTPPDNAETPTRTYTLDEIKDGMLVETHTIAGTKSYFTFGRLPMCDFPMDHPSISRYHSVLQFSAPDQIMLVDLDSSHGTFVNKRQIRPNTPHMLDVGDQIKFGVSSRTWCLGTTDAEFCEQREEAKHQEMQRKILEHAQQTENLGVASQAVRQGNRQQMTLDEDDVEQAHTDSGNPVRADWTGSDQAWYRRNPIGSLQIVLDEHCQDYDPEVLGGDPEDDDSDDDEVTKQNRKPGQTTVRIALPFIDDHGKPLYGIGQATKQHEAERRACLDALEELDKRSYLSDPRELRQRASKSKKQPLDNSDEDDDEFYDRTRSTKNQHKAQVSEVETFETLTDKHRVVCTEVVEIEQQLKEMLAGEGNSGDAADELDAYMNALTHKEEQQQQKLLEMKLGELKKEMERLITLIKIVAPDHQPQPGPKRKPQPRPEPKVPLTKLVHAPPASSAMPPPAMPAKRPAADIKQKETPKQRKIVAGPTLPPPMAPAKKQDDSAWQAPAGQTGDGKTALNDKFGY